MGQPLPQPEPASSAVRTGFAGRPPSAAWEAVALADSPQHILWVWFKPPNVPQGLLARIPDEVYRDHPHPEQLTMRKLLQSIGIEPSFVSMWSLYGAAYDAMGGTTPLLDAAIPQPAEGVDPSIVVYVNGPVVPRGDVDAPQAGATQHAATGVDDGSLAEMFRRIDADWRASCDLAKNMVGLRRKLVDMFNKLKTLNRELDSDERRYSNTQDRKDWLAARRWLRDTAQICSRHVREHDIGDTSSAGQREWFEETYREFILPHRQFDGMQQAQRSFESHRKLLENLQMNMKNSLQSATENGERRAQQVLSKIAAKVRDAKTNKNFLGVMLD